MTGGVEQRVEHGHGRTPEMSSVTEIQRYRDDRALEYFRRSADQSKTVLATCAGTRRRL